MIFNKKQFIANFEGIDNLAYETTVAFLKQVPHFISLLGLFATDKSEKNLASSLHHVKGAASYVCADLLLAQINHLEELLNANEKKDLSVILQAIDRVKTELIIFSDELTQYQKCLKK
jgi:hypothetical protein